ncbi:hypothetical protein [Pseudomonas sp. NPDC090201]|uniref:hypothetical protein n=1 Tax=Pseudomonas sp. NPDC090201 TaxID=3364475 RepID=UPI0038271AC9
MKNIASLRPKTIYLALALILGLTSNAANANADRVDGIYNLEGVMEMGANLVLRENQTFSAEAYYGSAHGFAKGTWYLEDGLVRLEDDSHAQPARKLEFDMAYTQSQARLEEKTRDNPAFTSTAWRTHYILEMKFPKQRNPPKLKPEAVHLEFDDGSTGSVKLPVEQGLSVDVVYPYDAKKILKRFSIASPSGSNKTPLQWFNVSDQSRMFLVDWKKPKQQPIIFGEPEEPDLAKAQRWTQYDVDTPVDTHYVFSVYHDDPVPAPRISPVNFYWQFDDGAIQQTTWSDSTANQLTLPYTPDRVLQKIGMRMKETASEIEWFEVNPDARWLSVEWKAHPAPEQGDLSVLFDDLRLEVEPGCLVMQFGTDKGCFIRQS